VLEDRRFRKRKRTAMTEVHLVIAGDRVVIREGGSGWFLGTVALTDQKETESVGQVLTVQNKEGQIRQVTYPTDGVYVEGADEIPTAAAIYLKEQAKDAGEDEEVPRSAPTLTNYEQKRAANMARNAAFLATIGLQSARSNLPPAVVAPKTAKRNRRSKDQDEDWGEIGQDDESSSSWESDNEEKPQKIASNATQAPKPTMAVARTNAPSTPYLPNHRPGSGFIDPRDHGPQCKCSGRLTAKVCQLIREREAAKRARAGK